MSGFDYRTPYGLLAIWLLLVAGMAAVSGYGDWRYLFLSAVPSLPGRTTQASPVQERRVRDLMPPAQSPPPLPASHAPLDNPRPGAKHEVSEPRFSMDKASFGAAFRLGAPGALREVRFQKSPAAWIVDLDGAWERRGREEYRFNHPLIRKVRILPRKDYLRFVFYYSDKRHKHGARPEVDVRADGVSVLLAR